MTPRVLVIAGSDSGGGAGIQADIKTITMLGGHAMTAVTAITAQNTLGVQHVSVIPSTLVSLQIASVLEDLGVDCIKIGMLGSALNAAAVAKEINLMTARVPVVFDPVMVATSGAALADDRTIETMHRLARMSTVVTPNLPELAALSGVEVIARERVAQVAAEYGASVYAAVLVKGGHAEGELVEDRLIEVDGTETVWTHPRIDTPHTHGTGCTLASAIATGLGAGLPLTAAVGRAIDYVQAALAVAPGLGRGHGPMGHALGVSPFEELRPHA